MRLRRHYKNYKRSRTEVNIDDESQISESERELADKTEKIKKAQIEHDVRDPNDVKEDRTSGPFKMIKQLMSNPNFNMQIIVILLALTSDSMQMDRRIDGMTTTIEKVRNITELVNNGMKSMRMVSEVPKSIRQILE